MPQSPGPQPEEQALTRSAQILLVEDNRMDVEFILEVFRQARLTNAVHVARTGLEAIDYLLERGEFADREALSAARPRAARSQNILVSGNQLLREIKLRPL